MSALSVESAKNIAIVVAVVFVVLSVVSALIIKNIVTKLILVVLMGGLALGAWSQRNSLSDCADRAQAEIANGTAGVGTVTCKFFGTEVDIPAP
jgi:high-affinity Fe2+/Pb2+ permease